MTTAAPPDPPLAGPEPGVLAPDFYRYRWEPLDRVALDGHFVELWWGDGRRFRAFDRWLRENGVGSGVDPATREGVVDPAVLSPTDRPRRVELTPGGALRVVWPGGHETLHHPGWLRHVAEGGHRIDAWLPRQRPWLAAELPDPPTHDGPQVLADEGARHRWLTDLLRFGIARLRDLDDPDGGPALAAGLGPLRDTNFGRVWDVVADPEPTSTAYTDLRLPPHTDLPTREVPPGFQMLHCLANDADGGAATMADGLAVVDHLRRHEPDHFEALTTLRWTFSSRGRDIDHRWSAPLVTIGPDGVLTLRAFHPVRGFPDMDEADLPRAYDALRCFSRTAAGPRFQIRFRHRPGDLVAFDNRRILHGRDAFVSTGRRHLRGLYLDRDDVLSSFRVAARRAAAAGPGPDGPTDDQGGPHHAR